MQEMRRKHDEWRMRVGAAMQLSQALVGQAAALRAGLLRRAGGECDRHDLEQAIAALKHELDLAETLAYH